MVWKFSTNNLKSCLRLNHALVHKTHCAKVVHFRPNRGRGQPLSFTLSFGEIPWFDEEGEIRRCDSLKRNP
jgi:hypothetical protein